MVDLPQVESFLSALKTTAPWVTGGLAGAALTLIAKAKSERKTRKIILLSKEVRRFSLNQDDESEILGEENLKVSYKGKEYDHLLLYSISMKNVGYGGIENQKLIFLISAPTEIVAQKVKINPLDVPHTTHSVSTANGVEKHYEFSKITTQDNIKISYLVNSKSPDPIQIFTRGQDGVEYLTDGTMPQDLIEADFRKLLAFFAIYVLFDAIPFFSGPIQACVVLFAIPTVVNIFKGLIKRKTRSPVNIGDISLEGENRISIQVNSR